MRRNGTRRDDQHIAPELARGVEAAVNVTLRGEGMIPGAEATEGGNHEETQGPADAQPAGQRSSPRLTGQRSSPRPTGQGSSPWPTGQPLSPRVDCGSEVSSEGWECDASSGASPARCGVDLPQSVEVSFDLDGAGGAWNEGGSGSEGEDFAAPSGMLSCPRCQGGQGPPTPTETVDVGVGVTPPSCRDEAIGQGEESVAPGHKRRHGTAHRFKQLADITSRVSLQGSFSSRVERTNFDGHWIVFSWVSKDTGFCIKPRQYQMSLTTTTSGP